MLAAALSVLAVAAPHFVVETTAGDPATVSSLAEQHWHQLADTIMRATHGPLAARDTAVRIVGKRDLPSGEAGHSRLGVITLRSTGEVTEDVVRTLRHELAHQMLWMACPAANDDQLFHEAFAIATSGEVAAWAGAYVSTPQAVRALTIAPSLDGPQARTAIARLLRESGATLPPAMALRLATCGGGTVWRHLAPHDLAESERVYANATIVINRHSGEIVSADGAVDTPMPFGSVLKPFIVAGAASTPLLPVAKNDSAWACGDAMPKTLDAAQALARSCNGYFMAWSARDASAAMFGRYGAMLVALGMQRLPTDMSEAIGTTPTLELSPRSVAEAYRALGPLPALEDTIRYGTLAGLGIHAGAFKTGTVRDPQSRPLLGWLVQVTPDLVAVKTVAGKQPRDFAVSAAKLTKRAQDRRADVQTFGLVGASQVTIQCAGVPMRGAQTLDAVDKPVGLSSALADDPLVCLGAPWSVRVGGPQGSNAPRQYAGSFAYAVIPEVPAADTSSGRRALRARRGSEVIFTTSLGAYVAGVTHEEGGPITGAPREALVRVIAHNVYEPRHGDRPVCDTTHCQVFKGTVHIGGTDAQSLARGLPYAGWLPFALGGNAPWEKSVPLAEVTRVLGHNASRLRINGDQAVFVRTVDGPSGPTDESVRLSCEVLRNALHLQSCPSAVNTAKDAWIFRGNGSGHSLGLDLKAAQATNSTADSLLSKAYGPKK